MRVVLQRVSSGRVEVDNRVVGQIAEGYVLLTAISQQDSQESIKKMAEKVLKLRLFGDDVSFMQRNILEEEAAMLVISQFTLYGECKKGTKPSFTQSASAELAQKLYEQFVRDLQESKLHIETGEFQAKMEVHIVNDGPVTLILES